MPADPPALALRKALDRVLAWIGDEGCSCDGDGEREIHEHDLSCPGTVERLLLHCQECFGKGFTEGRAMDLEAGGFGPSRPTLETCGPCEGTGKDLAVCAAGMEDLERLGIDWEARAIEAERKVSAAREAVATRLAFPSGAFGPKVDEADDALVEALRG